MRSGTCSGGSCACMSQREATGDKRIQGPVTEWTECLTQGGWILVCWWGAHECVFLGELVCTRTGVGLWGR